MSNTISQIQIGNDTYDIMDAEARTALWDTTNGLVQKVEDLENSMAKEAGVSRRIALTAGTDLNTLVKEGRYVINDQQCLNAPSGYVWYDLFVFSALDKSNTWNNVLQIAMNYNGNLCWRGHHDTGSWTDWQIVHTTNVLSGSATLDSGWSGWLHYRKFGNILYLGVWAKYDQNINSYQSKPIATLPNSITGPFSEDFMSAVTVDGSTSIYGIAFHGGTRQVNFVTRQASYSSGSYVSGGGMFICY